MNDNVDVKFSGGRIERLSSGQGSKVDSDLMLEEHLIRFLDLLVDWEGTHHAPIVVLHPETHLQLYRMYTLYCATLHLHFQLQAFKIN